MLTQIAFFVIAAMVIGLVLIYLCDWDDSWPPEDESFKDKDPDWWYGDDNDRR